MKNGAEIKVDGSHYRVSEAEAQFTLVIKDCKDDDKGAYKAVIENKFGKDESSAELKIVGEFLYLAKLRSPFARRCSMMVIQSESRLSADLRQAYLASLNRSCRLVVAAAESAGRTHLLCGGEMPP